MSLLSLLGVAIDRILLEQVLAWYPPAQIGLRRVLEE
jgi:hypothetical protein